MRFIGSKTLLLPEIEQFITENTSDVKSFCDIFSGTASVARHFKKDYQIISNDLLHFSYVLQRATIENDVQLSFKKLINDIGMNPFEFLNTIDADSYKFENTPFIYENYSPNLKSDRQYLTNKNALKIDCIRQSIEKWRAQGLIDESEYYYLLAGLIESIPYVSNIAGTYGAFLKHWDKRAFKDLKLIQLEITINNRNNVCFNEDSNNLIQRISGDILYIDPPYNARQYAPNYHLLETISRYDMPEISGKTGLRNYQDLKSSYCLKREALITFDNLIKNADFKDIIISYSTEGIMTIDDIKSVLIRHGDEKTYCMKKLPYRRYKHKAGVVKHDLNELLFYISKNKALI
jgi:adenine-specific DNA-methyltransferase